MSGKNDKLIRRTVKKQMLKDFSAFSTEFSNSINSLPFGSRFKFAWYVIAGRVD